MLLTEDIAFKVNLSARLHTQPPCDPCELLPREAPDALSKIYAIVVLLVAHHR